MYGKSLLCELQRLHYYYTCDTMGGSYTHIFASAVTWRLFFVSFLIDIRYVRNFRWARTRAGNLTFNAGIATSHLYIKCFDLIRFPAIRFQTPFDT
jgi:hypothetical protein